MTTVENGGPAFPADEMFDTADGNVVLRSKSQGMTLRDWFAGKALAGELGTIEGIPMGMGAKERMDQIAVRSYDMADAMLRARGDRA